MNFNLKKPCNHCPFRSDISPFLKRQRAAEISNALVNMDESFPCHKTVNYDNDEPLVPAKAEHCAGALIMLEHMDNPNQMMRIAERLGIYDRFKLEMNSPVFTHSDDFINSQGLCTGNNK
jgi:hypothetical protein